MAGISKAERERRAASNEAKQSGEFGGAAYVGLQEQVDRLNEIDERRPDWRPATITDLSTDPVGVAEDNRQFAGDQGKALNQMVGRAAITENSDPFPHVTRANNPPVVTNPAGAYDGEGDEVQLLRGYVPLDAEEINGQATKRVAGEVLKLPAKEARSLVNRGIAKFTDVDA